MQFTTRLKKLFQSQRWVATFTTTPKITWVLLFFGIIHLVGITDPPLEMAHSWRQSFTAMVTRNYVEQGMDWFYPRIDMAGEKTGIVGAEFPLFNYFSVLLSRCFGYQHWYGRCVNLAFVLLGAYHFFFLIKGRFDERIALYAVIILLSSSWFTFSRKIMPDTFSVALVIVGLRYGFDFWISGRWSHWIGAVLCIALGVLSKIPAVSLLSVVLLAVFTGSWKNRNGYMLILGSIVAVIPALLWYFYWVPYLNHTFGYHLFFPKGLVEGWNEIVPLWRLLLEKFYFTSYYSFVALLLGLLGLISLFQKKMKHEALALALISLVFGVFILKTGAVFPQHTYYSIPFVPVMALLAALGLNWIISPNTGLLKGWGHRYGGYFILLLLVVEAIGNQFHDHFIKPSEQYKNTLETEIQSVIPLDSKVVFVSSASPQELFLLHRKGWTVFPEQFNSVTQCDEFRAKGADFVVLNVAVLQREDALLSAHLSLKNAKLFYNSAFYQVYTLKK